MTVTLIVTISDLSDGADPELLRDHVERIIGDNLLDDFASAVVTIAKQVDANDDGDDETDGDMNVRPRTVCGCGYQLVWTDGEWQHDAAPSLWGNDHDPDAEPPAEGEGRWHWDEADCIDREILAFPVVASEAEIPEGLLPDGVGYHEGLPFNGVLEAITAATALLGEHDGVVYFDICEGSESSRIVRVDRDGVQRDGA